jgi:hypothetical protein
MMMVLQQFYKNIERLNKLNISSLKYRYRKKSINRIDKKKYRYILLSKKVSIIHNIETQLDFCVYTQRINKYI